MVKTTAGDGALRYLIVLDLHSPTGQLFAESADRYFDGGAVKHPALACSHVVMDSPHYIFAKRHTKKGHSHQLLYLPHHSVILIFEWDSDGPAPIGFV